MERPGERRDAPRRCRRRTRSPARGEAAQAADARRMKIGHHPLDLAALRRIAREAPPLELEPACLPALRAGHESVERIVASGRPAYGINTGFGDCRRRASRWRSWKSCRRTSCFRTPPAPERSSTTRPCGSSSRSRSSRSPRTFGRAAAARRAAARALTAASIRASPRKARSARRATSRRSPIFRSRSSASATCA